MAVLLELTPLDADTTPPLRIARDGAILGRSAEVEVPIADESASRRHARLNRRGDDFELENLSPNGTKINGRSISKKLLKDGDIIELGAATRLRVRYLTQTGTTVGHVEGTPDQGAQAAFDDDAPPPAPTKAPTPKPSLFRKPKVIIGLSVYFILLVGLYLLLETSRTTIAPPPGLSRADIESMMDRYFAPESPAFQRDADPRKERAALDRAREAFNTAPVSAQSLWQAAYSFREAQAYRANHGWRDPDDARRFRKACRQLNDRLCAEYIDALAEQRNGRLKPARDRLYRLQQIVRDRNCELNRHIARWLTAINAQL